MYPSSFNLCFSDLNLFWESLLTTESYYNIFYWMMMAVDVKEKECENFVELWLCSQVDSNFGKCITKRAWQSSHALCFCISTIDKWTPFGLAWISCSYYLKCTIVKNTMLFHKLTVEIFNEYKTHLVLQILSRSDNGMVQSPLGYLPY